MGNKIYVVKKGYSTGIFIDHDWDTEVKPLVSGFKGAMYKGFSSLAEAESYWGDQHIKRIALTSDAADKNATNAAEKAETTTRLEPIDAVTSSTSTSNPNKRKREDGDGSVLCIYTDGSCLHNGTSRARAGYGVYFGPGDERNVAAKLIEGEKTNNRAEMAAIITALELSASHPGIVEIHSDSSYCSQGITSWIQNWKRNGWMTSQKTVVKNKDLWIKMDSLYNEGGRKDRIKFIWVKAHNGTPGNEAADRLANQGALM